MATKLAKLLQLQGWPPRVPRRGQGGSCCGATIILTPVLHQRSGGNRVRSLCATGAHIPLMAGSSAVGDSSPIRGGRTKRQGRALR